jgi:glycosyltransferase involved in cell wall biosynthesis
VATAGARFLVTTVAHRGDDARILHREIAALLEAGSEVVYVAPEPRADMPGLDHIVVPRATGRRRVGAWLAAARVIRARRRDADLVLVHDLELVLPARIAAWGRRVVWDVHEDLVQSVADRSWIPAALRPAARAVVSLVERLARLGIPIILAEHSYTERFGSWPVVPNTTRVPDSIAPYAEDGPPRIVYVGRISWSRGLADMIEVGRRLGDRCSVELVGAVDADARTALDDAVDDGVVTWHGYLANSDALALTEGALAGLSLLGEHGNFVGSMPTKIFEYLARGVPVITTPLPLARSVVEDAGAGFTVGFGDVDGTVAAVERLLGSPALREAMGQRGFDWVAAHHDWRVDGRAFVETMLRWSNPHAG